MNSSKNSKVHISLGERRFPAASLHAAGVLMILGVLCQTASAKLNVVATTPDFGAIASAVGGSEISVTTLANSDARSAKRFDPG